MIKLMELILSKVFIYYIRFVYATSKITKEGYFSLLRNANSEKFIIAFWHGENYCFFPLLKGESLYVVATKDRRGNYISSICNHYGYVPIRMSDDSTGDNSLFRLIKRVSGQDAANLAITLDGPLGPYHQVKKLPLATAVLTKRRLVAVSMDVKRKVRLKKRWDKYVIPLPFNEIKFYAHEPLLIERSDLKENAPSKANEIKNLLEQVI